MIICERKTTEFILHSPTKMVKVDNPAQNPDVFVELRKLPDYDLILGTQISIEKYSITFHAAPDKVLLPGSYICLVRY